MGQRLNLQIRDDESKIVLNVYYHWGGYTTSAMAIANEFIELFNGDKYKNEEFLVRCVKLLQDTGARLEDTEVDYINNYMSPDIAKKLIEGNEGRADRNGGLIAVSACGVLETIFWEEARVELIYYKGKLSRIALDVFWVQNAEYMEELINSERENGRELPVNPFEVGDINSVTPEEFKKMVEVICDTSREWFLFIRETPKTKTIYTLIE